MATKTQNVQVVNRKPRVKIIDPQKPWDTPHEKRGLGLHDHAIELAKEFSLGVVFTATDFDNWAVRCGLLTSPPVPRSETWTHFVHRRAKLIIRLRKAASHPRMIAAIGLAFDIGYDRKSDTWMLLPCDESVARTTVMKPLQHYLDMKRRKFHEWCQGAGLENMPHLKRRALRLTGRVTVIETVLQAHVDDLLLEWEQEKDYIREELTRQHRIESGIGHNHRVRVMIEEDALMEAAQ